MSMVGKMNYFLGVQVTQKDDGIFISQSKYAKNLIKKFDLEKASHKRTPAATHLKITKDDAESHGRVRSNFASASPSICPKPSCNDVLGSALHRSSGFAFTFSQAGEDDHSCWSIRMHSLFW
ncbi:unnamed protein product [Rhodiola kirilowii]